MTNIFTLENVTDFSEKLNMDELYEGKRQHDLNQLSLYNKLLNRIHVRIKTTAKQKIDEHFCWFIVPEIMIGVPKYNQGGCIAYLIDKLKENGFQVRYIHPNTLMISWQHFVPSYVRNEIKKKTGVIIDENGLQIGDKKLEDLYNNQKTPDEMVFKTTKDVLINKNQKKFTPITSYKPQGNLVYNDELLHTLENKFG